MDVIPSAPPIYPELNDENFRLNKANLILAHLEQQTKHYEKVRKKYARDRSILHKISITTGSLSVVLTGSGVATSLTGPGIVIGVPLASVGVVCGIIASVNTSIMKKLSAKISKHDQNIMLAKSKCNTIADLVSKALSDGVISDSEFSLILSESNKYEQLKTEIGKKIIVGMTKDQIDEIYLTKKKDIYEEVKKELQQKLL